MTAVSPLALAGHPPTVTERITITRDGKPLSPDEMRRLARDLLRVADEADAARERDG